MVRFILIFLFIMSCLYTVREILSIIKTFRKGTEFKQKWYDTLLSFSSIAYIITFLLV